MKKQNEPLTDAERKLLRKPVARFEVQLYDDGSYTASVQTVNPTDQLSKVRVLAAASSAIRTLKKGKKS